MGQTYKATGINLKAAPLGESDRVLTILTPEYGLIQAVAAGARKPTSKLGGRSGLFVVNQLVISKGRSLDRITQAEIIHSYPSLSRDLGRLTVAQYWAELVLCQALSEQPQVELYELFTEHLNRLEHLPLRGGISSQTMVLAHLVQGIFHLLAVAGVAPQVQACCITQHPLIPDFSHPDWRVGFSVSGGGIVSLSALEQVKSPAAGPVSRVMSAAPSTPDKFPSPPTEFDRIPEETSPLKFSSGKHQLGDRTRQKSLGVNTQIGATELTLLQQLAAPSLPPLENLSAATSDRASGQLKIEQAWVSVEHLLREYAQHHLGRSIRSAVLMDSYFSSLPSYP